MKASRVLINNGANLERVNQYGLTPLISAALSGKVGAVKLLIEAGAVVDLAAEFSRDHNEDDRDYRDYSENDSRALEGLTRLVDSSSTWAHGVRPERRNLIDLLLHCSFSASLSLATASCYKREIFAEPVKQNATFPRGPAEISTVRTAILQSRTIPEDMEIEWQWSLTARVLLGIVDAMEEIWSIGSFALAVCHELLNHESHALRSVEDVFRSLEIPSLLLAVKDVLDRVWIVAKRDILYSESVGSGTGIGVEDDDKKEEESGGRLEDYPSYKKAFYGSASGEYGANDYTSYEGESGDFETEEDGSEGYAANEDILADDVSEEFASDLASEAASDEASDKVPSENPLRWRGWNMECLPECLEDYGSLLKTARPQLGLNIEVSKKESQLGQQYQLAENAARLIRVHTEYYDQLYTQTRELYRLWSDKLDWERWR
ncbi:hypothetical protein BJX65DRAFT_304941 [Aspergillus insuetus]